MQFLVTIAETLLFVLKIYLNYQEDPFWFFESELVPSRSLPLRYPFATLEGRPQVQASNPSLRSRAGFVKGSSAGSAKAKWRKGMNWSCANLPSDEVVGELILLDFGGGWNPLTGGLVSAQITTQNPHLAVHEVTARSHICLFANFEIERHGIFPFYLNYQEDPFWFFESELVTSLHSVQALEPWPRALRFARGQAPRRRSEGNPAKPRLRLSA
jgi:hypothetical protein